MPDAPVVLITGAARRIGETTARHFHQHGYRVIVHYNHSREDASALVDELNAGREDSADLLRADLTSHVDVDRLGVEALSSFGRLDVLVNNASSFYPTVFGESTQQDWDDLVDSNLRAAYFLSQSVAESLKTQRGAIVNIIDTYADRPLAGYPIYSIAKAGLRAMTRSLALELAPEVRVNGVAPGSILWPPALMDDDDPAVQEKRQESLKRIPLGRQGKTIEIADTVFFLATQADYVSGQMIAVDGGRRLL